MRLAVRSSLVAKAIADMAIVEDRVVLAVGLGDLVERLGDQIGADAIAGHEGERRLEEVEPSQRRKLVEHHQQLVLAALVWDRLRAVRSGAGRSG